jgi:hypothetical protein
MSDVRRSGDLRRNKRETGHGPPSGRAFRALVAILLIVAFAGMLLATHKYFRTRWGSSGTAASPAASGPSVVGRQGTIVTNDVYLRSGPGRSNATVGVAEKGSVVQVLDVNDANNWYEVQVIKHGREKEDPDSADRGWITRKYFELNN